MSSTSTDLNLNLNFLGHLRCPSDCRFTDEALPSPHNWPRNTRDYWNTLGDHALGLECRDLRRVVHVRPSVIDG